MKLGHLATLSTRALPAVLIMMLIAVAWAAPALAQLQGGTIYPINGTEAPPTSFQSIGTAVTYMTANGVAGTGQVILELSPGYAGETGYIIIPAITGASSTLGITFRPTAGYTALTSIVGGASPNYVAIRVLGSYFTFDGQAGGTGGTRDWTIRCTGATTGVSAFRFGTSAPTAAQTDGTLKYCILEGETPSTTSGIVGIDGASAQTIKNITIANNLIRSIGVSATNCRGYGITLANASNAGNTGFVVRDNVIRDFHARGINLTGGFPGILIYNNDIAHTAPVTQPSTAADFHGIYMSTTASPGAKIYNNFIHDIQLTNGSTMVNGVYVFNVNSSGDPVRFYNNRIDIGAGIAPTTLAIYGFNEATGTGGLLSYDYNSVYIGGSPAAGAANSAAFRKTLSNVLNVRNNVFYNARSNAGTASGVHWAVSTNNTSFSAINNNDYFVSGTGGVLGTTDGTATGNKTTLAAWKAAVTLDTASISQNPNYVNPTAAPPDMHVDTTIATQLESGGLIVAGINDDFEGNIRYGSPGYAGTGTAPDIGADEFAGTALDLILPSITYALMGNTTGTLTRAFTNVTVTDASGVDGTAGTRPRVYYKKSVNANAWNDNTSATDGWKYAEANGSTSPFDFTIDYSLIYGGSVTAGDVIQYFVVAQDLAPVPNVGINAGTFAATPASVALAAAAFPIGGTLNSYNIAATIAGNFTVGSGGTYGTLKAAFDDINAKVVNGDILLTILASGTTETASAVLNAVVYEGGPFFTITVKPDVSATPTITGSIAGALVKLNGADHVVFDGSNTAGGTTRDLTLQNTSASAGAVIWMSSLGAGQGCQYDTVKHCVLLAGVDQSVAGTETFAILTSGATLATSSSGADNDFNTFLHNDIRKVRWGIFLAGILGNPNDENVIDGNLIGPAAFGSDQIGLGGVIVLHQNLASIVSNEIRCIGLLYAQTGAYNDRIGIGLGTTAWPPSASVVTNSRVEKNLIHDIADEKTGSAVGIDAAGSGSPSNNVIANNMIYGLHANGTGSDQTVGLGIGDGNGDLVVFNTINLSGDLDPGSATSTTQSGVGIRIAAATPTNLTLKNNIMSVDYTSNTSTLKHYAIVAPAASFAWGTGGCDNNDYYVNLANAQMVLGGLGLYVPYTNVTTLAAWQATFAPAQDAASLTANPPFVLPTDLHLITGSLTELESGGVVINGVPYDYDSELRNAFTPDIGADEFEGFVGETTPPTIAYALLGNTTGTTTRAFTNVTVTDASGVDGTLGTRPRVYFKTSTDANAWNDNTSATDGWKYAEANGSTSPFDFTIDYSLVYGGGVAPGEVVQYFVVAQDLAPVPNVGILSGSFAATPASVALTAAAFPIGGSINSYTIVPTIAGEFTVGTGGTYGTLKAAFDDINAKVVVGDVTLKILASGTTETATAVLNPPVYEGGTFTITVKPDAGATPTVAGAITGALVKLNGADNVVFEGSNGTVRATKDLTFSNTGTAAASAAIWLSSQGAGAGCTNVTVRNCMLRCGSDQSTGIVETFGIISSGATISTSSYGADNDNNTFAGNDIRKVRWGIYLVGITGNLNESNSISGNVVGPDAFGSDQIGRGGIILQYQNLAAVTGNEVRFVGILYTQTVTSGYDRIGIGVGANIWTPTATAMTNSTVTGNLVHDISEERTYSAVGIVVAGSGAPSGNLIANNMIYNVHANGTSPDQGVGIGIGEGNGDRVVFNSIRLSGNQDPVGGTTSTQSACGIRISSTTPSNLTLKDNVIYADVTSTTVTLKHYAIVAPSTAYLWGTGGCDNNDYYVNAGNAQMSLGGIGTSVPYTAVPTLAGWRTQFTPNQDGASIDTDPLFAGATNLHIDVSGIPVSPVANAGVAIAGVAADFDGDGRLAAPDMGADEFASYTLATSVVGGGSVLKNPDQPLYNPGTQVQLTAVARGWAFVEWTGDATGSDNPVTITMDGNKSVTAHFLFTTAGVISDVSLEEGDSGTTDFVFTVTLSEASPDTVEVGYVTADSTATVAGNDYIAATGTLVFVPGDVEETFTVQVVGDTDNEPDEIFQVRLVDPDGIVLVDGLGLGTIVNDDAASAVAEPMPTTTFLGNSFPNPCGGNTTIAFGLHVPNRVELRVYDLQGRVVRNLMSGTQTAGFKRVVWDGRDNGNREVGAGCYFVRMQTPQKTFEQRILVLR
jgi:uncharacterized repeat protein (TIGR02543 family)